MAYWLMKSEPDTWSWADQVKAKTTFWDGVRNHQASNSLKSMKQGDHAFFYHSGDERAIVGIVAIVRTYYPDPSDETGKFGMVDVKAVKPLARPVSLAAIKGEPKLANFVLVRQSRLSVMPVAASEWAAILKMAATAS
jgi:predicted RNA-binding protein with PUA-like domain